MIVERIWTGNAYRNFNYLIACPETGEALAIDPLDHEKCLAAAKAKGWQITQILNTHEHRDHTGGNEAMVAATGARLLAHFKAGARIAGVDRGVKAGDVIKVGKRVELECMDTPGHTMCHICLRSHTDQPALFSGDTLFNAGAGNCHNGGDPSELYATFVGQLAKLPDDTKIYPGHDYIGGSRCRSNRKTPLPGPCFPAWPLMTRRPRSSPRSRMNSNSTPSSGSQAQA
jgi:hydroxyacylglutathione hydrolase